MVVPPLFVRRLILHNVSYQVMMIHSFKSSIRFYRHNKAVLQVLKVNGKEGKYCEIFFIEKKKECGERLLVIGWYLFSKVLTASTPYWIPPTDDKIKEILEDNNSECESEEL